MLARITWMTVVSCALLVASVAGWPLVGRAFNTDVQAYPGVFCIHKLWGGGHGYLWSDGKVWNDSTSDQFFSCPVTSPVQANYSDFRLWIDVSDGNDDDAVECRPFACGIDGSCGWWSTQSSAGTGVQTLSWSYMGAQWRIYAGAWCELPERDPELGTESGIFGYRVQWD